MFEVMGKGGGREGGRERRSEKGKERRVQERKEGGWEGEREKRGSKIKIIISAASRLRSQKASQKKSYTMVIMEWVGGDTF